MNISLKPSPIIAIWLPGFALTTFVILCWHNGDKVGLFGALQLDTSISFWPAIAIIVASFIVGQFLDAIRDILLENFVFEKLCGEVKWQFFFEAKKESLENLDEWFYSWYEMDANIVVGSFVAIILALSGKVSIDCFAWIIIVAALVFFFLDAKELRSDIKEMIDRYYERQF